MEEEDEAIIMVELTGLPNPEWIHKCKNLTILGIDTPEPVLQMDNSVFKGVYEDIPGTYMVFDQGKEGADALYVCKTSKKLSMSKVVIQKNTEHGDEPAATLPPGESSSTET